MTTTEEKVICVLRDDVEAICPRTLDVGRSDTEHQNLIDAIEDEGIPLYLLERSKVENNANYLQLVVYTAVFDVLGNVLTYRRGKAGSEARLHDQLSLGFGGHMNADIYDNAEASPEDFLEYAFNEAERELREELKLQPDDKFYNMELIGLIHDPSSDVGKVHLGLAIRTSVMDKVEAGEDSQQDLTWHDVDELEGLNMEAWSVSVKHLLKYGNLYNTYVREEPREVTD